MAAAGHDHPATIGRSQPSKSARLPLRMSAASKSEYDCGCQAATPETTDDDDSASCASVASESSTAVGEEDSHMEPKGTTTCTSKGTSPFLSDSELNRALLEIREFGLNMNISLLDDEM
ncbi:hypothetical protein GGI21_005177 [Coemansia aciculifera]|nr:hypothetical protein GGI21_005177 [Coemansia aciculifera]